MLSAKLKSAFFDAEKVIRAIGKARAKVLSKAGAFVRTAARSSIKKSKKTSEPGSPPRGHGQQDLKRKIFFAYDSSRDSVVVGPEKLNIVFFNGSGKPASGTVPQVLEEGGTIGVLEVRNKGKWRRADLRSKRRIAEAEATRIRKVTIAARPFMGPALVKESNKWPLLFRDAVK